MESSQDNKHQPLKTFCDLCAGWMEVEVVYDSIESYTVYITECGDLDVLEEQDVPEIIGMHGAFCNSCGNEILDSYDDSIEDEETLLEIIERQKVEHGL